MNQRIKVHKQIINKKERKKKKKLCFTKQYTLTLTHHLWMCVAQTIAFILNLSYELYLVVGHVFNHHHHPSSLYHRTDSSSILLVQIRIIILNARSVGHEMQFNELSLNFIAKAICIPSAEPFPLHIFSL